MRNFHEHYKSLDDQPTPSDRAFGLTLACILAFLGLLKAAFWSLWIGAFFMTAAGIILGLTYYRSDILARIKTGFLKAAPRIASIINPVLMGIVYVICFIPGGYIMRLLKHDPLKRAYEPYAVTYWQKREEHDLPDPMKYQF